MTRHTSSTQLTKSSDSKVNGFCDAGAYMLKVAGKQSDTSNKLKLKFDLNNLKTLGKFNCLWYLFV